MNRTHWRLGGRIPVPRKERAKGEVLYYWELGEHFGIEHLYHAFVDLAPPVPDARDVEEDGTVFPEGALLDVVDEGNGRKVNPRASVRISHLSLGGVAGPWRARCRALQRCRLRLRGERACELCRAKNVREEGMVIKAPDTVRSCRLKVVCEDKAANNLEVSVGRQQWPPVREERHTAR